MPVYVDQPPLALYAPPKHGSTTCVAAVTGATGARRKDGQHDPVWMRPDKAEGRTRVAPIRNLWAWYPSWWLHTLANDANQRGSLARYGGGSQSFRDVLYGATHATEERCPDCPAIIANHASNERAGFIASGMGLASWLILFFLGEQGAARDGEARWGVDVLIATERMYEGLDRLLCRDVDPATYPILNTRAQRQNNRAPGMPADYRDWYDAEMLAWVSAADGWLIRALGQRPFEQPPQALYYTRSLR